VANHPAGLGHRIPQKGRMKTVLGDLPKESANVSHEPPETALLRARFDEFNDL